MTASTACARRQPHHVTQPQGLFLHPKKTGKQIEPHTLHFNVMRIFLVRCMWVRRVLDAGTRGRDAGRPRVKHEIGRFQKT